MKQVLTVFLVCLLATSPSSATTYYISNVGLDSNLGLDKSHTWAHAPGMQNFTGTYSHTSGDVLVFKGGDVWPAQGSMLWQWPYSGTFTTPDIITSDTNWYSGGSWVMPVFTAQRANFNGTVDATVDSSHGYNVMFRPLGSNLRLQGIHWTQLYWNSRQTFQQVAYILEDSAGMTTNFWVSGCVFDDWTHGPGATEGVLTCIVGSQGAGFVDAGNVVTNCVFDGLNTANSTDGQSTGTALYLFGGKVINCVFRNMCNSMRLRNANNGWCEIGGFTIGPIYVSWSSNEHDNGLRIPAGSGVIPIHDGIIANTGSAMLFVGDSGETELLWNVLLMNPRQSAVIDIDPLSASGGKCILENCTIAANGQPFFVVPGRGGAHTYGAASLVNCHVIGTTPPLTNYTTTAVLALTNINNVFQSTAAANAQGYQAGNFYKPTSTSVATYGAGIDVSSTVPGTSVDLLGVARPQASRWDAGAYEFLSTNPGTLSLAVSSLSVAEGSGLFTVTTVRSGGTSGAVSGTITAVDGSAVGGHDYSFATQVLSWADGATGARSASGTILASGDTALTNRTFQLTLSAPTGGAGLGAPITETVTIVMNPPPPPPPSTNGGVINIDLSGYSVYETSGNAVISVTRTGGTNAAVTVHYATSNSSAVAGTDYTAVSGTLSWTANQNTTQTINVPIANTGAVGPARVFFFTLSSPTGGATIGLGTSVVSIIQNGVIASGPVDITVGGNVQLKGNITIQGR